MELFINELTQILTAVQKGERKAAEQLLPLVYAELRKLAAAKMSREASGHTLQPTALVHEAWLRLAGGQNPGFEGRAHFFAAAAEAMRRILIDRARSKRAKRHGGDQQRLDIDEVDIALPGAEDHMLAVDEALERFAAAHPVPAKLLKLRYFAGLTVKEAASTLGISPDTAKDYSAFARAWLFREITRDRGDSGKIRSGSGSHLIT